MKLGLEEVVVLEACGLGEQFLGGLGEVVEDEVEEFFAFFWGGEVGATGEAFVCALVHVAAYEHAVKGVGDEFPGVGELGLVDEFGA